MAKWTHRKTKLPSTQRTVITLNSCNGEMHTGFWCPETTQFLTNTKSREVITLVTHWSEKPKEPN